jgi:hypothetical protein
MGADPDPRRATGPTKFRIPIPDGCKRGLGVDQKFNRFESVVRVCYEAEEEDHRDYFQAAVINGSGPQIDTVVESLISDLKRTDGRRVDITPIGDAPPTQPCVYYFPRPARSPARE